MRLLPRVRFGCLHPARAKNKHSWNLFSPRAKLHWRGCCAAGPSQKFSRISPRKKVFSEEEKIFLNKRLFYCILLSSARDNFAVRLGLAERFCLWCGSNSEQIVGRITLLSAWVK